MKIAIEELAGCSGCTIAVLDLHEALLEIVDRAEIVYAPVIMDVKAPPEGIDIAFVTGAVRNRENEERLNLIRKVAAALDELPPFFHEKMSNVEVIIEAWPTRDDLRTAGVPFGQTLLGLYQGVPLTQRGAHYQLALPDRIAIFQGPIEQAYQTPEAIRAGVRRTVIHELAHHFGISDDRLRELGAY